MPKINAFEKHASEYDEWFIKNDPIYFSELNSIRNFVPQNKYGLEIGVGSGRFAFPLDIKVGVEPSPKLAKLARNTFY